MSVTKRTRFEVLRRDEHTCQYCGQKAPDIALHVDHVIPVALGGSDDPSNLVAACRDCNTGKASISPDSPVVASVSARSAQWALANANRNAHIEADLVAAEAYQEEFLRQWDTYTYTRGIQKLQVPLPADWRPTLTGWWRTGVPAALVTHAIQVAMGASKVTTEDTFRYFAGVIWRTLDEYDQRYSAQTAEGRVYSQRELDEHSVDEWMRGWHEGRAQEAAVTYHRDLLSRHIDGLVVT